MAEANSVIERIKQKLDIVEEIGAVVPLKKSGKAFKGLCPFHGERTPSFYVMPETGTWKCFGCGEGGDIFTFVEKQQGLDFREALQYLAERAGVPLDSGGFEGGREETAETAARKRLRALNEAAAIWFHSQLLQAPEARYARSYLESRGVSNESLTLWRLGYAPEGDALTRYLCEQGYSADEVIEAGLARRRDESKGGGLYDYFRNRVIFPIRDARGRTAAFGGRELGGGQPKYLNSPQTALFDKSATLYGLDLARDGIRKADQVVIVEGYMDALVTHQYGFRNVVACIGSAITEKHVRQVKKLTRRMALALDPDAAGESATLRAITVAQQAFDRTVVPVPSMSSAAPGAGRGAGREGRGNRKSAPRGIVRFEEQVDAEITIVQLPPHEDPDEFVRRDAAGWRRAVENAAPLIDYLIEAETSDLAIDTPQGKLQAAKRLIPIIAEVRNRTLAADYVDRVARRLRLPARDLELDLMQARQRLDREPRRQPEPAAAPDAEGDAFGDESEQSRESVASLGEKYRKSKQEGPNASYSASVKTSTTGIAGRLLAERALEEECLGLLLEYPAVWAEVSAVVAETDLLGTETRAIFHALDAAVQRAGILDGSLVQQVCAALPESLGETAQAAREQVSLGPSLDGAGLVKAARDAAYRLKRLRIGDEMAELDYLQRDAEQAGDLDGLRALLRRKQLLLSQRRAMDAASALYG